MDFINFQLISILPQINFLLRARRIIKFNFFISEALFCRNQRVSILNTKARAIKLPAVLFGDFLLILCFSCGILCLTRRE